MPASRRPSFPPPISMLPLWLAIVCLAWGQPLALAAAAPPADLPVPAFSQRFSPPEFTGVNYDSGEKNCVPASLAMVLQYYAASGAVPPAFTSYLHVRRAFRLLKPDAEQGFSLQVVVDQARILSQGKLKAEFVMLDERFQATPEARIAYLAAQTNAGNPVIANVNDWSLLNSGRQGQVAHAVIVVGASPAGVAYIDPWDGVRRTQPLPDFDRAWGYRPNPDAAAYYAIQFSLPPQPASPTARADQPAGLPPPPTPPPAGDGSLPPIPAAEPPPPSTPLPTPPRPRLPPKQTPPPPSPEPGSPFECGAGSCQA